MKQETEVCATSCSSFLHKHKQTVFQDTALKQFQSSVCQLAWAAVAVQWEAAADSGSSLRTDVTTPSRQNVLFPTEASPSWCKYFWGANVKYFSRLQLGLGGLVVAVAGLSHRYAGWCVVSASASLHPADPGYLATGSSTAEPRIMPDPRTIMTHH